MLDRNGNTLAQVLKSAWIGEMTGTVAAAQDRRRILTPGEVRVTSLIGIQIDVAAQFLAAEHLNGGLPQRVNWAWAYHPQRKPPDDVDWPGPLPLTVWDRNLWGGGDGSNITHTLGLERAVAADLRARQDARADSPDTGLADAHAEFSMEKTAGILALMHGEMTITQQFWDLACLDWELSVAVREEVSQRETKGLADANVIAGRAQAARNLASIDVYLDRAVASLARKVASSTEPLLASQAKDHLSSYRKRHKLAYTEIVDAAIARGVVVVHKSGGLSAP